LSASYVFARSASYAVAAMSFPLSSNWSSQKPFRLGSFQTANASTDGSDRARLAMYCA